jgi:hypothetical protein
VATTVALTVVPMVVRARARLTVVPTPVATTVVRMGVPTVERMVVRARAPLTVVPTPVATTVVPMVAPTAPELRDRRPVSR